MDFTSFLSLGPIGDSIVGTLGGGLGGQLLGMVGVGGAGAGGSDIGAIGPSILSGGAGGGALMAIIGVVRQAMAKSK
jgi:hypothetical protein